MHCQCARYRLSLIHILWPAALISVLPVGCLFYMSGSLSAATFITVTVLSLGIDVYKRQVKSGNVTIRGVDIRNVPLSELMNQISMVFQRVYLFQDTIYNNIICLLYTSLEAQRATKHSARKYFPIRQPSRNTPTSMESPNTFP